MQYEYGEGHYIEGAKRYKGRIIVDEYRLYLAGSQGDFTQTYVPLEKIEKIKRTWQGLEIRVKLSAAEGYTAVIKGGRQQISRLVEYLVRKLNLRKKFLRNEWVGEVAWR